MLSSSCTTSGRGEAFHTWAAPSEEAKVNNGAFFNFGGIDGGDARLHTCTFGYKAFFFLGPARQSKRIKSAAQRSEGGETKGIGSSRVFRCILSRRRCTPYGICMTCVSIPVVSVISEVTALQNMRQEKSFRLVSTALLPWRRSPYIKMSCLGQRALLNLPLHVI